MCYRAFGNKINKVVFSKQNFFFTPTVFGEVQFEIISAMAKTTTEIEKDLK